MASELTESDIQEILHTQMGTGPSGRGHRLICPNVKLWGWESDLVSVTKTGYAVEYEIKRSKSDFRADRSKTRHSHLLSAHENGGPITTRRGHGPCRFFYVFPPDLEWEEFEIPSYAGVMTVTGPNGWGDYLVSRPNKDYRAPRLHSKTIAEKTRRYLERGLMWRYWEKRKESSD